MVHQYSVIFEKDEQEGGWIASASVLHCHTQGDTREEVEENIREAILCCLEGFQEVGIPIPMEE